MQGYKADTIQNREEEEEEKTHEKKNLNSYVSHTEEKKIWTKKNRNEKIENRTKESDRMAFAMDKNFQSRMCMVCVCGTSVACTLYVKKSKKKKKQNPKKTNEIFVIYLYTCKVHTQWAADEKQRLSLSRALWESKTAEINVPRL